MGSHTIERAYVFRTVQRKLYKELYQELFLDANFLVEAVSIDESEAEVQVEILKVEILKVEDELERLEFLHPIAAPQLGGGNARNLIRLWNKRTKLLTRKNKTAEKKQQNRICDPVILLLFDTLCCNTNMVE